MITTTTSTGLGQVAPPAAEHSAVGAHCKRLITLAVLAAATTGALTACGTAYPLAPTSQQSGAQQPSAQAPAPVAPVAATATDAATRAGSVAGSPAAAPVAGHGSGTVPRTGPGSGPAKGSAGTGGPATAAPAVASFRVVSQPVCAVHGTPAAPFSTPGSGVTISWSVTGAGGAALAVDNPTVYGAYGTSYPAKGQQEFPFSCESGGTTTHTFTVWPAGATGTSKTLTVSAHSDG